MPSPDAQNDNAMDGFEKKKKKKRSAEEILQEEREKGAIRKVKKEDGSVISVKVPSTAFIGNDMFDNDQVDIPKDIQDTLLKEKGWMAGKCNCQECRNFRMRATVKKLNMKAIPE